MTDTRRIIIIGAGAWGAAAAVQARARGAAVILLEADTVPAPAAASTDVSKAIRAGYGADRLYSDLMLDALAGWRRWNDAWPRPLFHETGVLFLAGAPGGFEDASRETLTACGAPVEALDPADLRASFPQWANGRFTGGYFNAMGGWAESGAVVRQLVDLARAAGVEVRERSPVQAIEEGVVVLAEERLTADVIIVAAGARLPALLPELADRVRPTGHPVFLLAPPGPGRWRAPAHPVFGADIARSGWYGFPALADGRLKIAHHGAGLTLQPGARRPVSLDMKARLRSFLSDALPALADAPLVEARYCVYADAFDGDFIVDRHPDRPGVIVLGAGSGHGFKFTPLVSGWIDALLEGGHAPRRFAWRTRGAPRREAARSDR